MRSFKVAYRKPGGPVRATVCSYTEELANDEADRLEDLGNEILDIVECKLGITCEAVAKMYEGK